MTDIIKKQDHHLNKAQIRIRSALLDLINEKPISQITVTELSDRANINRKTFYMYYSNTSDLIDKVENDIIEQLLHILELYDYFNSNLGFITLFYSLNELIANDLQLYKLFVFNSQQSQLIEKIKQIVVTTIIDKYADTIQIDKHLFALSTRYVASGILSMYIDWFNMETPLTLEEVAEAANALTLHGIKSLLN